MNHQLKKLILNKLKPISFEEMCDAEFKCIYNECVNIFENYDQDITNELFIELLTAKVGINYSRKLNAYNPPKLNLPSGTLVYIIYNAHVERILNYIRGYC